MVKMTKLQMMIRIKDVIGYKFVKVSGQKAYINEYGLTKVQVDYLTKSLVEILD